MKLKIKNLKGPYGSSNRAVKISPGFTLMEILIYIVVFSMIIAVLFSFIVWLWNVSIKTQVMRETLANVEGAMARMTHEIRNAQSIYIPTTTSSQLSLEISRYLPEGESSSYLDFFLCSTQLCLKKEAQDPISLTSDKVEIKNLSFSQVTTGTTTPSIQINLEAEYKNPQNLPEYRHSFGVTSTISLRSY